MKVLITGGSGLIGSALAEHLIKKGFGVNVLDRRKELSIKGINYFQGSVLEREDIKKAIKDCDYVFHLAAILGVSNATARALECLDVNILGTRNILHEAADAGVKKVLLTSSSEVYGEPDKVPIEENAPRKPKSEYGFSKCIGEEYCKAFKLNHDLNYSIVRYFNVYGPNQALKFVMPLFIKNALSGEPLVVYGSGEQVRSFCYVTDAVKGTEMVMFDKKADNDIFNIGNDKEPMSMIEAAKKVLSMAKREEEPVIVPFKESDRTETREIFKRVPDISKARRILGYEPEVNLDEGIRRIIEYQKGEKEGGEELSEPFFEE